MVLLSKIEVRNFIEVIDILEVRDFIEVIDFVVTKLVV